MKKSLSIVFVIIMTIMIACQKDDFCLSNPVTPNLVIRFKDATDTDENLEVDSLYVWAQGDEGSEIDRDSIYTNAITDSIAIPLNTTASSTTYFFAQGTQRLDKLVIEYDTEDEFVSRSCGFRVIFNNVVITSEESTTGWMQPIPPTPIATIDSQEEAHVTIFH